MKPSARRIAGGSALAVALASAGGLSLATLPDAAAQEPAQSDGGEIVVTAQKREQQLQDVPIAMSAFTSETLQNSGVTELAAVTRLAPNVNLEAGAPFSGSSSALSASIRGIGQDDFAIEFDPGVGVYLDGVYLARTVGANQGLMDVERIEILRGPQGTLFGRNTIGGAISIITRTPGDEFSISGQATTGSFNRRDFQVSADIPIASDLLSSFTFSSAQRDGFQERIPYPSATPYVSDPTTAFFSAGYSAYDTQGGQNEQVMRAKFLWTPSDDLELTWTSDWTHHDQPAMAQSVALSEHAGNIFYGLYNLCIGTDAGTLAGFGLGLVCGPRAGATPLAGVNVDADPTNDRLPYSHAAFDTGDIDTTYATGPNFDRLDVWGTALTADWELSDHLTLRSITAYRELDWNVGLDQDRSPIVGIELTFVQEQEQASQELQLLGDAFNERLQYVAGLYYFNETGRTDDHVPFPGGLLQPSGLNNLETTSYAAFAHLDFALTDRLGLTIGGRYSNDEKQFESAQAEANDFVYKITGCYPFSDEAAAHGFPTPPGMTCQTALGFPDPADHTRYFPPGVDSQTFEVFNPTVGIQYHFTDDVMTYLSYSEGYKNGGWTTRLTAPTSEFPTFGPEEAVTYEIGVKSEWFDRRLTVNWANFYTEYSDIQLNFYLAASPLILNGGDAEIRGSELDVRALLGGGFNLNASLGVIDAEYVSLNPLTALTLDHHLPKTPDLKYSLSPSYEMTVGNGGTLRLSADFTHADSMFNDGVNTPYIARPATDVLNLSIGYASPDERYEIVFGGSNVTDERFITTGSDNPAISSASATYSPPAQWYLTLRLRN